MLPFSNAFVGLKNHCWICQGTKPGFVEHPLFFNVDNLNEVYIFVAVATHYEIRLGFHHSRPVCCLISLPLLFLKL